MALTKTVSKYGVEFASAYHRITNLEYHVNEYTMVQLVEQAPDEDGNPVPPVSTEVLTVTKSMNLTVRTYADASARTALSEPISSHMYTFTPNWDSTDNVLIQGYDYLKTLPEFTDAVNA